MKVWYYFIISLNTLHYSERMLNKKTAIIGAVLVVFVIALSYHIWRQNIWHTFENDAFSFQYLERMGDVRVREMSLNGIGRGAQDGTFRKDGIGFSLFGGTEIHHPHGYITFEDPEHKAWNIFLEYVSFPHDLELVLSTFRYNRGN